jgi:hypothetical protein
MQNRVSALVLLLLPPAFAWAQSQNASPAPDVSQEAYVFEHLKESVRFENDVAAAGCAT